MKSAPLRWPEEVVKREQEKLSQTESGMESKFWA
jgi:hypothetical protein